MALSPGAHVGPYEVVAPLGQGGMGEVYRARDAKLGRDVALKILPSEFALDPERLARFRREAQVLASLSHPNIAAIYGFEESNGISALVLELVDGPTLAEWIEEHRTKGHGLPIDEALPIARQIAEALEAAHEQGIVHRDLKPANIKVRPDGTVKVLDFGLAKLTDPAEPGNAAGAGAAAGGGAGRAASPADAWPLTQSPTITTPALMTGVGVILGTAAYMSPEQAKGRPADRRSDIWAFGCVLYEMLTGRRAFDGEDVSDTLASILKTEPDYGALPIDLPAAVQTLIRRCLAKDRRDRVPDASVARFLLSDRQFLTRPGSGAASSERSTTAGRLRARYATAAALALGVATTGAVTWGGAHRPASDPRRPMRFEITLPASQGISGVNIDRNIALSPDGTLLVYVSGPAGRLMTRSIDRLEAEPLGAIFGARSPFFSPDGKWVGYFSGNGELRKVSIAGGLPMAVCKFFGVPRGATWGPDDTIVFAAGNAGLFTVPARGGEPKSLTRPDESRGEGAHILPTWLPDGRAILFTALTPTPDSGRVAVLDTRTGQYRALIAGGEPEYVSSGYLVYIAQGALRAVGFDPVSLTLRGDPESVEAVATRGNVNVGDFAVSRTGMLVYTPTGAAGQAIGTRTLVWVTRDGHEEPIAAPPHAYTSLRLSPDDAHIALDARDQQNNIWIWDVRARNLTRLTDGIGDQVPVWSPDGRRIAFSSAREGGRRLFWQFADGTGTLQHVPTDSAVWPGAFTGDGSWLVATEGNSKTGDDVSMISFAGDKQSTPLLNTGFAERSPDLSRDGHWIAYQSNEDGQDEIYVRPFPGVNGGRWQVTTAGGTHPIWGKSSNELFYLDGEGALTVVPIQTTPVVSIGQRTRILQTKYFSTGTRGAVYDVTRNDQRFIMIKGDESAGLPSRLVVVLNWVDQLARRVPTR